MVEIGNGLTTLVRLTPADFRVSIMSGFEIDLKFFARTKRHLKQG